ncbi:hypothetical protein [Streptomyces sp. NPDC101165]|uniref:hypothetical protein n=1 Tax=Streptomyces sp. NPDC101165 TaxID=3366119 RepID=UPI00380A2F6B
MVNLLDVVEEFDGVRHLGDWTIDGRALGAWMSRWTPSGPRVSANGSVRTQNSDDLLALLGRSGSQLPSGRVPLYACSQCADLGCGTVAVRVGREVAPSGDRVVTWSDFAWESDDSSDLQADDEFADVPVLRFDATRYEALVNQLTR